MSDEVASADSRLALAVELLRSVIDSGEAPAGAGGHRVPVPFLAPQEGEQRLSATDLISFWFQPAGGALDPWDEFFSSPAPSGRDGAREAADGPWTELRAQMPAPEMELADEQAEAAVQCLYEFVHAVGRREVDRAMDLVAEDYHVLEADREIDRLGLRQQLEAMLGMLDGWEVEASLVAIPEAIPFPAGVAIVAEIQVDGYRPDEDAWRSIIQRRVAVLEHRPERDWQITALSEV